jgi:excisionase family DNA binding protein
MTSAEACEYLGITLRTLYRMVDQQGLVGYQMGRVFRFRRSDLEAWLAEHRIEPGSLGHLYPHDHDDRPDDK